MLAYESVMHYELRKFLMVCMRYLEAHASLPGSWNQ